MFSKCRATGAGEQRERAVRPAAPVTVTAAAHTRHRRFDGMMTCAAHLIVDKVRLKRVVRVGDSAFCSVAQFLLLLVRA